MHIDKKTLDELKNTLLKEKGELEESLEKIAKPVNKAEGDYETSFEAIGEDKDDNATEVDQYSQNLSIEVNLEKQLQDIIAALTRIEKGTYGMCAICGKEIPLARLQANPSAKTCLTC